VSRPNRQSAAQAVGGRGRGILHALWRCMARVTDLGFSLRRPTKILRTHGSDCVEAHQDRHRPTSQRMADVEGGNPESTSRQPDRRKLHALLPEPGAHHSRPHRKVPKVQSVSFDHRVTVCPAI